MATCIENPVLNPTAARIGDREFAAIRDLVYEHFGIVLTEQKRTLVVGRLQKVLRTRGFATFADYVQWLRDDRTGVGLDELANRISTNHTFFFRENTHFEFFSKTLLPEVRRRREAARGREMRFWCAGCSSGEEPYTLMMLLLEFLGQGFDQWKPLLLATDLSATVLRTAMAGVYDADRVEQLPRTLATRYFARTPDGRLGVGDTLRRNVIFRRHNLMDETYPFKKPFDAIFCRNVMIYFDRETRLRLARRFHEHTAPGGYLFIGHSESLGRSDTDWEYVMPALYRKSA